MRYLITGGTGLIGSHFVKSLPVSDDVTILSRQNASDVVVQLGRAVNVVSDLDSISKDAEFDVVLNLAGEPIADKFWSSNQKTKIRESRIGTTNKLTNFLSQRKLKPSIVLSGSAVGFYAAMADKEIGEDGASGSDFSAKLCQDWEEAARKIPCERLVILRTGLVLQQGKGLLASMEPTFKLGAGAILGKGNHHMPWIHAEDYVKALSFLIASSNVDGPVNLSAPNPVTNQTFSKALAAALHRPLFMRMPEFVLKIMFGERKELLLADLNVVPQKLLNAGFDFTYTRLEDALTDIYGQ